MRGLAVSILFSLLVFSAASPRPQPQANREAYGHAMARAKNANKDARADAKLAYEETKAAADPAGFEAIEKAHQAQMKALEEINEVRTTEVKDLNWIYMQADINRRAVKGAVNNLPYYLRKEYITSTKGMEKILKEAGDTSMKLFIERFLQAHEKINEAGDDAVQAAKRDFDKAIQEDEEALDKAIEDANQAHAKANKSYVEAKKAIGKAKRRATAMFWISEITMKNADSIDPDARLDKGQLTPAANEAIDKAISQSMTKARCLAMKKAMKKTPPECT